ncbi:DUF2339 domain-containing protein [bacterium]|jgi:hypothetical protein|nr:DUF2339 domain-containing protein [bacterium]
MLEALIIILLLFVLFLSHQISNLKTSIHTQISNLEKKLLEKDKLSLNLISKKEGLKPITSEQEKTIKSPSAKTLEPTPKRITPKPLKKQKREASKLDLLLKKMWNWILIGSENRPDNVSIEYSIASTWLLRIGIVAIVACVGYFLKWSMDHGILGPWGRISMSILSGLIMVVWGAFITGKRFHLIGQGLIGGGFATLYFSLFAAGPLYDKLATPIVFLLMIFVTICAAILSLQFNSMLIAILATVGGFATPLLLQSSEPNFAILFGYLSLLNLGVIGLSYFKQWRLLNYLAFYFTYSFLLGAMFQYKDALFPTFIVFSTFAFLIQAILVYLNNLRKKVASTPLEIFHLLLNTLIFTGLGYRLLDITFGRPFPAILALGLAIFFIGHTILFLNNKIKDRNLMITFLSLSGFFSVWTVPLIFGQETIGVFWSLQALMMMWLGLKLKNQYLKGISMLLYFLTAVKVLFSDIRIDYMSRLSAHTFKDYLPTLIEHIWQYGIIIGSFVGAFYLLENTPKFFTRVISSSENDTKEWITSTAYNKLFFWMGSLSVLTFLLLEVGQIFSFSILLQGPALCIIWTGFSIFFISRWRKTFDHPLIWVAGFFLSIPFFLLFISEFSKWGAGYFVYTYASSPLFIIARFVEFFILIIGCVIAKNLILGGVSSNKISNPNKSYISSALIGIAIFVFWMFLSFELGTVLTLSSPNFKDGGLSILWSVFAMSLLGTGIVKNIKNIRYCGLGLFSVVVFKVFFIDLAQMEMIVRMLAFFVVGILLILGAVAYIKGDKSFKFGGEIEETK